MVGAEVIGCQATEIEFRLLVNVDEAAVFWRAHPSGTLIATWPFADRYGT
jgi:hypothetical protein